MSNRYPDSNSWRARWHDIIFEAETPAGRNFDIVLLVAILGSLVAIMLESVESLSTNYRTVFLYVEWFFTVLFTTEYIMRLLVVHRKRKYVLSFYGIIDLLSILPTFLSLIFFGAHYFMAIRSLRLIRVFRVLKMVRFLGEARVLSSALRASRIKITVFLVAVMCVVFIMGTIMFLVEGKTNGFSSIPVSIYWCIVTLTTVGYGDISPQTPLGQIIASIIMVLGYGIIAVPTGIVTAEMGKANFNEDNARQCNNCGEQGLGRSSLYCRNCGSKL